MRILCTIALMAALVSLILMAIHKHCSHMRSQIALMWAPADFTPFLRTMSYDPDSKDTDIIAHAQ